MIDNTLENKIKEINFDLDKNKLINILDLNFSKTLVTLDKIDLQLKKNKDGLELSNMEETNPILWQCGHILGFYYKFITTNLKNLENLLISEFPKELLEFYDSYLTPNKLRYNKNNLLDINIIIKIFIDLYSKLKEFLTKNDLDYIDKYLIFLGILHTDMHIEALHFSGKYFNYGFLEEMIISNNKLLEIEFIEIPGGEFIQGYTNENEILSFDNERPSFKQDIKKFSVSKYPITQHQFMDFIRNGGYFKREYWSQKGWSWKREKLINYPLYYKDYNDSNLPMYHISYYEADAFCKMFKYRLLY